MGELEDAPEVDSVIQRMKRWVKEHAGMNILLQFLAIYLISLIRALGKNLQTCGDPTATVYPDYERDMYPLVPAIVGLRATELQKIVRLEFTQLWSKYYHITIAQ
jgi:hypothetical protein